MIDIMDNKALEGRSWREMDRFDITSENNKEDDDLAKDENTTEQLRIPKKKRPQVDDIQDNDEVDF